MKQESNEIALPSRFDIRKPEHREIVTRFAADRIISGEKPMDVKESIQEKFKLHNNRALEIVHGCKDVIRNQLQIKVPFILSIHIERYEYLYEKFRQIGQSDLMNLALQQKEELLNIKEALTERLQEDFGKEELENKFNYEKLTIDQRKRFHELVLKMQK